MFSEITVGFCYLLFAGNLVSLVFILKGMRFQGLVLMLLIAAFIVSNQLYLGYWLFLQKEVIANLTAYMYQYKADQGECGSHLSRYMFGYPKLRRFLVTTRGLRADPEDHVVQYFTGQPGTSHFIVSEQGRWCYYPDYGNVS